MAPEGYGQPKTLTKRALLTMVTGLFVLTALTVWRLSQRPAGESAIGLPLVTLHGETMGSTYTIKAVAPPISESTIAQGVTAILEDVDAKMSTYRDDSEIARFNASASTEPFPMSRETLTVMALALEVSRASGGAYDITVGPLVNAWGFGPVGPAREPTPEEIQQLAERTGYEHLSVDIEAGTAQKANPALYCDLGSIAPGYAVDLIAAWFASKRIHDFMIEVAGEVRTGGSNDRGLPWKLGIRKPIAGSEELQRVIELSGKALATSGDYQNFYMRNGRRISHIIDARTGQPAASHLASVTVIADNCATADAYATALTVLGPEAGLALAEEKNLAALFVLRESDNTFTERPSADFSMQFPP